MSQRARAARAAPVPLVRAGDAIDIAAKALLAAAVVIYAARAIALASSASYWMDEVLAVWTASEPSVADVWSALTRGSEFTPPLFDLILHGLREVGLTSPLAMRAPSIVAVAVVAAGVFVLVRRHLALPLAAVAAVAVLNGGLFAYAVQARPYACSTAAIVWAVALWVPSRDASGGAGRAIAIGALCALAISFHVYAVILVAMLGGAELLRVGLGPEPRQLWPGAMIALGAASILAWWPIVHAAAAFNMDDASAAAFYARPTMLRLLVAYVALARPLALVFGVVALASLVRVAIGRASLEPASSPRRTILRVGIAATLVPMVVFLFAVLVTHAFSERYAIVAASGFAVLLACLLETLGDFAGVAAIVTLVVLIVPPPLGGRVADPTREDALTIVRGAPAGLPIAMGSGLRFLELSGNEPAEIADRLVFLQVPVAPGGGDPTNRHQVERWGALRPALKMRDAAAFLCDTPRFLVFHDPAGGRDELPGWLAETANVRGLDGAPAGSTLVEVPRCPKIPPDLSR